MFSGASNLAAGVDRVFVFIFVLCAIFLVSITAVMIFFVFKYSKKRHPRGEDIEGHTSLEVAWTLIPLILFMVMFYFGWTDWKKMREPPLDAMTVKVIGRQWSWSFIYPNGKQSDELFLALDRPVKLDLYSQDVIHGFYIPAFRVKEDVVPGKGNWLWFTPTKLGGYDIECTVICGVRHSYMLSRVNVVPEDKFRDWYFAPELAGGPKGLVLMKNKGCVACHSLDGSRIVGPSFKGIYGTDVTVLTDGKERTLRVDDDYVRRSILQPSADIVKGYPPSMPPQQVTDDDVKDITEYIKSLK